MIKSLAIAAAAMAAIVSSAHALPTVSVAASVGGAPSGATRLNLDSIPLGAGGGTTGIVSIAFAPNAQAVSGNAAGVYAAPFLSGNNGNGFGSPNQALGADTTTYLAAGATRTNPGASITFSLSTPQQYMGLLWGSVDDYNSLEFFSGATSLGMITGIDVQAAPNGDQGLNGTRYVNINSLIAFDRVVATSTEFTFEIDNLAFRATPVSEPGTLAVAGLGLLGFGLARRGRK